MYEHWYTVVRDKGWTAEVWRRPRRKKWSIKFIGPYSGCECGNLWSLCHPEA